METKQSLATQDRGEVVYNVAGQDVKLSYNIVRNYLTKGNGKVSDQDLVQFISVCKFNKLNPFLNEAYLVKFGTSPAQMIVSKEALLKRADACPDYEGMEAGIIVADEEGELVELEGCFCPQGCTLVGGWAKVYRKNRRVPTTAKVNLEEYDKKSSIWNEKKSTMISKIAKVQALREAFPAQLGAMYTAEEQNVTEDRTKADNKTASQARAKSLEAKERAERAFRNQLNIVEDAIDVEEIPEEEEEVVEEQQIKPTEPTLL